MENLLYRTIYVIIFCGLMVVIVLLAMRVNHHSSGGREHEYTIMFEDAVYGRLNVEKHIYESIHFHDIRVDQLGHQLFTLDSQSMPGNNGYEDCPVYTFNPVRSRAVLIVQCKGTFEPFVFANFTGSHHTGRHLFERFGVQSMEDVASVGIYEGSPFDLNIMHRFVHEEDIQKYYQMIEQGKSDRDGYYSGSPSPQTEKQYYIVYDLKDGMRIRMEIRLDKGFAEGYGLYIKMDDELVNDVLSIVENVH